MGTTRYLPRSTDALIVVDVQNDFCPGGSLAVKDGDHVVPSLNALIEQFTAAGSPIFFTRDWHPADAEHFKEWPPHCVQDTPGAAFHPQLHIPDQAIIITKGDDPVGDAYSGFSGHNDQGVSLAELLHLRGVTNVYVGGLATDYCVKATVLDARRLGFGAVYLKESSRAVNLQPGDGELAEALMSEVGAATIRS